MTTSDDKRDDTFLDGLFAEERAARDREMPEVPADFLARVMADAEAVQTEIAAPPLVERAAPSRGGLLSQIGAALGGWPAFAGLAAASVTGLWLGISPPAGLSDVASVYVGSDGGLVDPVSGFDFDLGEG